MNFFDVISSLREDEKVEFKRILYPYGYLLKMVVTKGSFDGGCSVFEKTLHRNGLKSQEYFGEQLADLLERVRAVKEGVSE